MKHVICFLIVMGLVCGSRFDACGAEGDALQGMVLATKAFREAADKIAGQVVAIEGLAANDSEGGAASGILISQRGEILTSTYNLRANPRVITVTLANGTRKLAKLMGRDETRRLALLQLDSEVKVELVEVLPREKIVTGMWVVAVGCALSEGNAAGEEETKVATGPLSVGIVSATRRLSGKGIQTDANLSPLNYGGALVDIEGRLIGINVPFVPGAKDERDNAQWYDAGVGFAIPVAGLESVLERMRQGETLRAGVLGAEVKLGKGNTDGAVLGKIVPKLGAEQAGLKSGDRIIRINEQRILDGPHLKSVLGAFLEGDKLQVVVIREEKEETFSVELVPVGKREEVVKEGAKPEVPDDAGKETPAP